jgi:Flp pilus assembly protein TadG
MRHLRLFPALTRRRGVVAPLVALLLVALFGVVALAVDAGLLMADRREAGSAADAAALAAAIDLFTNYQQNQGVDANGTAATSAKDTAKDNGYQDGINGTSVTINIPPASGPYQGLAGYAEVLITVKQQRFFSSVFGGGAIPVSARAVARGTQVPKNNGIIVLDPKDSNTLTTTNTANITVVGGNIIVDSDNASAGSISNSGNITANELDFSGSPGWNTSGSGKFVGTILSKQTPTPDPLASLPPPAEPSPSYNNVNISNLPTVNGSVPGWPTPGDPNGWTLPAGTYDNGIQISDNNPAHTYTLQSGLYYFDGGGLSLTANANIKSDTGGVCLYFHSGGGLSITAGGSVTLAPLQSGTYKNITIYEDRNNTSQDSITGQSTGSLNISGTVYTPAAKFTLTGAGGNYAIGSQYIVYQLVVTGSGNFNVLYNGPQLAPNRYLYLVE